MVVGELLQELIPVLLVVVDAEVAADVEVQQEPGGAAHTEVGVGVCAGRGVLLLPRTHQHMGGQRAPSPDPSTIPETFTSQYLSPVLLGVIQVMGTIQV